MKIPTILGMALLITAIVLGVMIYFYKQGITQKSELNSLPKKIQVVNLSDTSATIVWQTDQKSPGQIAYGPSQDLNMIKNDNRDKDEPKDHLIHFVTLTGLAPNTKYYFKIKIGENFFYPDKSLDFKTASTLDESQNSSLNKPIHGTILNTNLNPVDEALVFLKIDDAQDYATFTSTAGNFIIPLTLLRTKDLNSYYQLTQQTPALLFITRGELSSNVELSLPLENQVLPPLTLGQNINLKEFLKLQSQKASIQKQLEKSPDLVNKFDLNNDGKVNSLDLAKVIDLYNSKQTDKKADFNSDGAVNQQDIDTISQTLGL